MLTASVLTTAKTWKQWTEAWIKKMRYIHTVEYYSATRKNEIIPFVATWVDLEIVILSEVKSKKEKYHMTSLMCGI